MSTQRKRKKRAKPEIAEMSDDKIIEELLYLWKTQNAMDYQRRVGRARREYSREIILSRLSKITPELLERWIEEEVESRKLGSRRKGLETILEEKREYVGGYKIAGVCKICGKQTANKPLCCIERREGLDKGTESLCPQCSGIVTSSLRSHQVDKRTRVTKVIKSCTSCDYSSVEEGGTVIDLCGRGFPSSRHPEWEGE